MHIILRLICENLSRIAVKISFLWGHIHCVLQQSHLQQLPRRVIYVTTYNILLLSFCIMNIICNAQWLYGANFEILHCSEAFSWRKTLFKQENFKQTRVDFFYRENMTSFLNNVTATLRALFAMNTFLLHVLHHLCKLTILSISWKRMIMDNLRLVVDWNYMYNNQSESEIVHGIIFICIAYRTYNVSY